MRRMPTVPPSFIEVAKVVEQLVVDLVRNFQLLLQGHDLVYQHFVALRKAEIVLLQLLNLVLSRIECLAQERNLLVGRKRILRGLCFPWGRRFAADIVEVVFAVHPELWVLEFPGLHSYVSQHNFTGMSRRVILLT